MQSRALLMLLIALILGGVAAYLVQTTLQQEEQERVVMKSPETMEVVVAAVDMDVGTRLEPVMLSTAPFPKGRAPEGAYTDANDVLGEAELAPVVIKEIRKGEVVLPYKLSPPGARAGLAVKVDQHMRAITIATNEIQGVAGFVLPGDRVDVLHTTTAGRAGKDLVTRTLLQNIKVLAVDQVSSEKEDEPKVVNAATLLMTPEEAQKVTLAQQVGEVTLALRNEGDVDEFSPKVIRLVDLQTGDIQPPPPQPRPVVAKTEKVQKPRRPAPPKPAPYRVEVIRGLDVKQETVKVDEPEQANVGGQQ